MSTGKRRCVELRERRMEGMMRSATLKERRQGLFPCSSTSSPSSPLWLSSPAPSRLPRWTLAWRLNRGTRLRMKGSSWAPEDEPMPRGIRRFVHCSKCRPVMARMRRSGVCNAGPWRVARLFAPKRAGCSTAERRWLSGIDWALPRGGQKVGGHTREVGELRLLPGLVASQLLGELASYFWSRAERCPRIEKE